MIYKFNIYKRLDGEWRLMAKARTAEAAVRVAHALGGAIRFEMITAEAA